MSTLKLFVHEHSTKGDQSVLKTITFAITHFTVAFTVAYLLTGDILIGSLIAAEWLNANGRSLQPSAIHWYRQGDNGWVLISETATTSYTIQPQDLGLELMAVAIVVTPEGHQRIASTPVGPVTGP